MFLTVSEKRLVSTDFGACCRAFLLYSGFTPNVCLYNVALLYCVCSLSPSNSNLRYLAIIWNPVWCNLCLLGYLKSMNIQYIDSKMFTACLLYTTYCAGSCAIFRVVSRTDMTPCFVGLMGKWEMQPLHIQKENVN